MALELASLGFNIVLVSRNKDKLQKVADLIQEEPKKKVLKVQVKTIHFDFAKTILVEDYKRDIVEKVADLDISILINNVGPNSESNGDFENVSL